MITEVQGVKQDAAGAAERASGTDSIAKAAAGNAEGDAPESLAVTRMFTAGQIEGMVNEALHAIQVAKVRS